MIDEPISPASTVGRAASMPATAMTIRAPDCLEMLDQAPESGHPDIEQIECFMAVERQGALASRATGTALPPVMTATS